MKTKNITNKPEPFLSDLQEKAVLAGINDDQKNLGFRTYRSYADIEWGPSSNVIRCSVLAALKSLPLSCRTTRPTGRELAEKYGFKKVSQEEFDANVAAYTGGPVDLPTAAQANPDQSWLKEEGDKLLNKIESAAPAELDVMFPTPPDSPAQPAVGRGDGVATALKLFQAGYQSGHHDTVEGHFHDDPRGADTEYYHSKAVSEILGEAQPTAQTEQAGAVAGTSLD